MSSDRSPDSQAVTKSYVDSISENARKRRDSSTVLKDQDKDFDQNKLANLDTFLFNRELLLDEGVA